MVVGRAALVVISSCGRVVVVAVANGSAVSSSSLRDVVRDAVSTAVTLSSSSCAVVVVVVCVNVFDAVGSGLRPPVVLLTSGGHVVVVTVTGPTTSTTGVGVSLCSINAYSGDGIGVAVVGPWLVAAVLVGVWVTGRCVVVCGVLRVAGGPFAHFRGGFGILAIGGRCNGVH